MSLFGFGKEKRSDSQASYTKSVEPPVNCSMFWLCEKCGFKLSNSDQENLTRGLQKALKSKISEAGKKRECRVLVSSCMNICPNGKIAATKLDIKSGRAEFFEFAMEKDMGSTAARLFESLK